MKLGLALSGGAARGLAHVGVIEVLEQEGIQIDMVAGTSMGAIVGAAFARGLSAAEIKAEATDLSWGKLAPLIDINPLQTSGIFGARRIKKKLKNLIGDPDFSELEKRFACIATDLFTGKEVVFTSGKVLDAVLASMSLPLVFKVSKLRRQYLVDGGIVDPLPVTPCRNLGADKVIAVNVLKHLAIDSPEHSPNIMHVLSQVIYIASAHLANDGLEEADVAIEPNMTGIHLADFNQAPEAILRGQLSATDAVPHIKRLLKSMGV